MNAFDSLGPSHFIAALNAVPESIRGPERICVACTRVLDVQSAAIAVDVAGAGWEVLGVADRRAERIEGLQATVGEGPGLEAFAEGMPVIVEDLAWVGHRWPLLAAALQPSDRGSIYALPLQIGAARMGVLDLYCDRPRQLVGPLWAAAQSVATMVTMMLLGDGHGDGHGAEMILGQWWSSAPRSQEIHQASGMVAAQLAVPVREAYVRLQAHAFAEGRTMAEIAHDVVQRRLRFSSTEDP